MNVIEALNSRTSIRAFKPDPVSRETILKILEAATRSPSWANTQPWEIFVAAGKTLKRLRQGFEDRLREGAPRSLDLPAPQKWPDIYQKRMAALKADRDKIPGVASPGEDPRKAMMERNYRFFDAPVVVYLCMNRALTPWSIFDIGMLSQSIMLAAQEYGVDSIPAVNLVSYPDLIRAELGVPPDLLVLFGIGLGHRDTQQPLSQIRRPRRPLSEVVHIKGLQPATIRLNTDAAREGKDTMKPVAGLWIDHRRAVVVVVTEKGEETRTIESHAEKHVQRAAGSRHGGRFESQAVPADDSHQREYTGELDRYYDRVAAHIKDAEAVLIFGPGEAKGELKKRIERKPARGRLVEMEAADKMTVSQIVAKVRQRFVELENPKRTGETSRTCERGPDAGPDRHSHAGRHKR